MATGTSRRTWPGAQHPTSGAIDLHIAYDGKEPEEQILRVRPTAPRRIWPVRRRRGTNALYFGDNLGLLAHLHRELRGTVRLAYIDPPFASRMVYHSRSDDPAYTDLLDGAHYVEFLRKRLVFLREAIGG